MKCAWKAHPLSPQVVQEREDEHCAWKEPYDGGR